MSLKGNIYQHETRKLSLLSDLSSTANAARAEACRVAWGQQTRPAGARPGEPRGLYEVVKERVGGGPEELLELVGRRHWGERGAGLRVTG